MSIHLAGIGISECLTFYNIADNQTSFEIGPDKDLIVGKTATLKLQVGSSGTLRFRNVVVLGNLKVYPTGNNIKLKIIAKNAFIPKTTVLVGVDLKSKNFYRPANVEEFNQELREKIWDWNDFQKQTIERIGLKSILI